MQINNETDRTIEVNVAAQSSQTLWTTSIGPNSGASKALSDSDAPFTVTGRWAATPPLQFNWIEDEGGTGKVPSDDSTVTVSLAYPGFHSSIS